MNVIVIVLDSFRQDHVGFYHKGKGPFEGVAACRTPNIDRFAAGCVAFDNACPEALPTIPVRCQLMTGQRTLPYRGWQPLTPQDVPMARILASEGYVCGLISDTYHYRAPGMNYHQGFHCYRWIRGQEYDPYVSSPSQRRIEDYVNEHYPEAWRKRIGQFLANTDGWDAGTPRFTEQVAEEAVAWLRANRVHQKVFLWVDSFDPHEPWDPPKAFDTYTDPAYRGPRLIMPMGGMASSWATPEQVRHIRGLYAGEAAFVDHCLGPLFKALEELGYFDDSLILLLSDHGHPLGDHGKFLKGADRMYNELLRVPFMVRFPGGRYGGQWTSAIVQFHDALPTVLDAVGLGNEASSMHGRSFLPVLKGDADEHRDVVITGYHHGIDRCTRDRTWSYVQRPGEEPDELYHLGEDPQERVNLIDRHPDEAVRLARAFGRSFKRTEGRVVKGIQGQYELASGSVG